MKYISSKALILFLVVIFLVDSVMSTPIPCKKGHQLFKKPKHHKKPHHTDSVAGNATPLASTGTSDSGTGDSGTGDSATTETSSTQSSSVEATGTSVTGASETATSTTSTSETSTSATSTSTTSTSTTSTSTTSTSTTSTSTTSTSSVPSTTSTTPTPTPTPPPPPPPPSAPSGGDHSGQGTFFTPGLGACGGQDNDSSAIVALASPDFDPSTPNGNPNKNPLCGRQIRLFRNGKSADATVTDRCPECKSGDVDMSPAVFNQIASPSEGRVEITWKFL